MPNISEEELHAIEDQLSSEEILIKKYKSYATMAVDPQIKSTCEQLASQHKTHYDTLMGYLY